MSSSCWRKGPATAILPRAWYWQKGPSKTTSPASSLSCMQPTGLRLLTWPASVASSDLQGFHSRDLHAPEICAIFLAAHNVDALNSMKNKNNRQANDGLDRSSINALAVASQVAFGIIIPLVGGAV